MKISAFRMPNALASLFGGPQSLALLLLALASGFVWLGQTPVESRASPASGGTSRGAKATIASVPIPNQLGLWTGRPLEVTARAREILETDDVALMEYRLGAESPVWLARVAGFGNRAAFHPPELCYVGSHFEVLERSPITVLVKGRIQRVMRLVIGRSGQRFEAWYWFTAGNQVSPSYYQQQAWLLLDAIRRKPMSGTLVRVSTLLDEPSSAHRRLLAFLTSWDALSTASPDGA